MSGIMGTRSNKRRDYRVLKIRVPNFFFSLLFPFYFFGFFRIFFLEFFLDFSRIKSTKKKVKLNLIKVIRFKDCDQATFQSTDDRSTRVSGRMHGPWVGTRVGKRTLKPNTPFWRLQKGLFRFFFSISFFFLFFSRERSSSSCFSLNFDDQSRCAPSCTTIL